MERWVDGFGQFVWPTIAIVKSTEVYKAVTKALEAGVDGLWHGREWEEIQPKIAEAFGSALKDSKG